MGRGHGGCSCGGRGGEEGEGCGEEGEEGMSESESESESDGFGPAGDAGEEQGEAASGHFAVQPPVHHESLASAKRARSELRDSLVRAAPCVACPRHSAARRPAWMAQPAQLAWPAGRPGRPGQSLSFQK